MTRQIVLDTETTGLDPKSGHRLIEIGCVEIINRKLTGNHYHQYIQPNREVDEGAFKVHGISNEFLADKPLFKAVAQEFLAFIKGAELIIHNAPFDVGFIDHELGMIGCDWPDLQAHCTITDTLVMARKAHPGQKNNLDALCSRYDVNNAARTLHGALLDAEILADVYLAMTGGQMSLSLEAKQLESHQQSSSDRPIQQPATTVHELPVLEANSEELAAHAAYLAQFKSDEKQTLWETLLEAE